MSANFTGVDINYIDGHYYLCFNFNNETIQNVVSKINSIFFNVFYPTGMYMFGLPKLNSVHEIIYYRFNIDNKYYTNYNSQPYMQDGNEYCITSYQVQMSNFNQTLNKIPAEIDCMHAFCSIES